MLTPTEWNFVNRIQASPVDFIDEVLGDDLWPRQREIATAAWEHPKTAVRSSHGIGKSYLAARFALAFHAAHSSSIVVTTAPTFRQVEKILWKEIRKAYREARGQIGGRCLTTELKRRDDWFMFGFATDVPDNFQGMHAEHILVIVDEASGLAPDIWDAIEGVLSGGSSRLLAIGNPTDPTGEFAQMFKEPGVAKFHVSAFDTPNFTATRITQVDIESGEWEHKARTYLDAHGGEYPYPALVTPEWVYSRYKKWGKDSPLYQARVLGDFPEQVEGTLIPLSWIEKAQERTAVVTGMPRILSCDVGGGVGHDTTCIGLRTGNRFRIVHTDSSFDTMEVAGMLASWVTPGTQSVNIDTTPLGKGVADRLREQGYKVGYINVGEGVAVEADRVRFANRKMELFWNLREALNPANPDALDLDPDDEDLAAELADLRYEYRSDGKTQMEKKEAMKKRIGRSPDRADTLMMAMVPSGPDAFGFSHGTPKTRTPDHTSDRRLSRPRTAGIRGREF